MGQPKTFTFASDAQEEFFFAGPSPTLFAGGYGSGKSVALLMKMLYLLDKYPCSRGAVIRRQYGQLTKTVLQTLFQWLPAERIQRFSEQQGILELKNGSTLYLMHLGDDASLNILRGLEVNFCGFDQLEEIDEDVFDLMHTRVGRWSGASRVGGWPKEWKFRSPSGQELPPPYLFASSNAPGFDSFVYRRWGPSPERPQWEALGYKTIVAPSWSNKYLGDSTLSVLREKGDEFIHQFVDFQSWGATEGLIHDVSGLSLLQPTEKLLEQINTSHRKYRIMDFGETAPTCVGWMSTDREGNLFYYKEYYVANEIISFHRKNITVMSKNENYDYSLADPSIFAKTRGKTASRVATHSVADEFIDVQLLPIETSIAWRPADNNEMGTRNRINEYLRVDPEHVHPVLGVKGSPRLFFVQRTLSYPQGICEILKETRSQRRLKIQEGVYSEERDPSVVDHGYDVLRYGIASRPSIARTPQSDKYNPNTWMGYSNLCKRNRQRRAVQGRSIDPTRY